MRWHWGGAGTSQTPVHPSAQRLRPPGEAQEGPAAHELLFRLCEAILGGFQWHCSFSLLFLVFCLRKFTAGGCFLSLRAKIVP